MTVIAWDGKTLAADKCMGFGSEHAVVTKIHRHKGELIGWAGESALGMEMREWYKGGADPAAFPAAQRDNARCGSFLVITSNGAIHHYAQAPHPLIVENTHYAVGSGSPFASAAMHLGHGARQAVEVACALDLNCGNGIDILELRP